MLTLTVGTSRIVLMYNTDDFMMPQLNVGSSGLLAVAGLTRQAGESVSVKLMSRKQVHSTLMRSLRT